MNQPQLYGIAIYEQEILLSDFTSGHEKRFLVEQQELSKLFRFDREITFVPFPGLVWMKSVTNGQNRYLITLKRHRRQIIYNDRDNFKHITMEFPNMALKARITDDKVTIEGVYGFKGELVAKSQLYALPLSNISGSNICEGGQQILVKDCVKTAIESKFFDTPFNHHNNLVGNEAIPFLDYVKKYRGKMPFKTLRKLGYGQQLLVD